MATASAERNTAPPLSRAALASQLTEQAGRFLRTLDHPLAGHLRTAGELARAHRLAPGREGLPFGSPASPGCSPEGCRAESWSRSSANGRAVASRRCSRCSPRSPAAATAPR